MGERPRRQTRSQSVESGLNVATRGLFKRIYAAVRRVPPRRVTTYGEIARQVGLRNGARTVGWALASLPDGETAPWWRVVRSEGTIANRRFAAEQRRRLRREGVRARVGGAGAIDLRRYGWPAADS
ncbi:MAG: MGMT family protein [Armatimonadota bacterium]